MATDDAQNLMISIEVAYAKPDRQYLIALQLPAGSTAGQAIQASGLLGQFPEIDLNQTKIGVFGVVYDLSQPLKAGDRVEIYRPLILDPKAARLQRAKK